jgi:FixJ family two-component response regulator
VLLAQATTDSSEQAAGVLKQFYDFVVHIHNIRFQIDVLAQRLSNKEIADKLFISATTVKGHLQNIYQKLEVGKHREAVEKAMKIGILSGGGV